jgi:hypothetical protein
MTVNRNSILGVVLVVFSWLSSACGQRPSTIRVLSGNGGGTTTPVGGSQLFQEIMGSVSGNSSPQIQSCGTANPFSSCTLMLPTATVAKHPLVCSIVTGSDETISSCYTCTSASGCDAGNAIDTFTLCESSGCHVTNSAVPDSIDSAYVGSGAGGATYVTVNLSGTPSSNSEFVDFAEAAGPTCGNTLCTPSVDVFGTSYSTGCQLCTGTPLNGLTGPDFVFSTIDTVDMDIDWTPLSYGVDTPGNIDGLDVTSGEAPTFQIPSGTWFTLSTVAFKFSGYTRPVERQFSNFYSAPNDEISTSIYDCSPTCSPTWAQGNATGTGDLLVIIPLPAGDNPGAQSLSSVSGGCSESWVIDSGFANTAVNPLSLGYCLSSASGATSVNVTLAANCAQCTFATLEISRQSGSFVWDASNSSSSSSTVQYVSGPTLTLSGSDDVCIDEASWNNTSAYTVGIVEDEFPSGNNDSPTGEQNTVFGMILNAYNNRPAGWLLNTSVTASASARICFK